jgi:hypothetical protein
MDRALRAAAVLLLMMSVAGAPIAADWCVAHCEAMRLASTADTPHCHHTESTARQIGSRARPCQQRDNAVLSTAAQDHRDDHSTSLAPTVSAAPPADTLFALAITASGRAGPSGPLLLLHCVPPRFSTLRI